MAAGKRDYYEVLGVQKTSTADEIKKSFRKEAFRYHPDRNEGNAEAEAKFKEATEAYDVLSDSEKRKIYDQYGHAGLEGQGCARPRTSSSSFKTSSRTSSARASAAAAVAARGRGGGRSSQPRVQPGRTCARA